MRQLSPVLLLFSSFIFLLPADATIHTIYWNKTNHLFTSEGYELDVRIGDTITIICPFYSRPEEDSNGGYLIINKVSDLSYMNCLLETPTVFTICDKPYERQDQSIIVRRYRSHVSMLEFHPGSTVYFISTSKGSKEGLRNEMNGLCMTHNMKMRINVHEVDQSRIQNDESHPRNINRLISTTTSPLIPSYSIPIGRGKKKGIQHEQRRHTKNSIDKNSRDSYMESEVEGLYTITLPNGKEGESGASALSGWDSVRMNADEMVSELKDNYLVGKDYIISEFNLSIGISFSYLLPLLLILLR